jgi:hypothetical protein
MKNTTLRLTLAALSAALLAACGGGGSSSPTTPALKSTTAPVSGPGTSSSATGNGSTRLTVGYTPGAPRTTHSAAYLARVAAYTKQTGKAPAAKTPQYVSGNTEGFQVTVTPAGGSPVVYNFAAGAANSQCANSGPSMTCALVVPTLGPTETISVQDVNNPPSGTIDPTTGIAANPSSFPIGTVVLATGTTPATTLTPGQVTNISLGLNPVIGGFFDCGFDSSNNNNNNIREDSWTNTPRIVVTSNVASSGVLFPAASDYSGDDIETAIAPATGTTIVQPFVDVDGTPKVATATLSTNVSPFFGIYAAQAGVAPVVVAPQNGPYGATASMPDTSYIPVGCCGQFEIPIRYNGFATLTGTVGGGTITVKSNLTATPPFNTSATPAQMTYIVAPLFLTASASTAAVNSTTVTLTAYNPGPNYYNYMNTSDCIDGNGNDLGFPSTLTNLTNGVQTWTFNAGSNAGTCTMTFSDVWTSVVTNPVLITIH